jgi:NTE family protein
VINDLRDRGYEIVGIAGSSMGALVGGLQAAGKLDDFAEWARSLTQRALLRLLDPLTTAAGVLRAEKILDAVPKLGSFEVMNRTIDPRPRWPGTPWRPTRPTC